MSLEEVTPAWVEEALRGRWPGVQVTSVSCDLVSHGAATRARLSVKYANTPATNPPPPTLWLKTGFEAPHDLALPNYVVEADFYKSFRPVLPIRSPDAYFAATQQKPGQATILMQDLT